MPRDERFLHFRKATEPNGFIKALALHVLVDPIGDGARKVSSDRKKTYPERGLRIPGAPPVELIESGVQPDVKQAQTKKQTEHSRGYLDSFQHQARPSLTNFAQL